MGGGRNATSPIFNSGTHDTQENQRGVFGVSTHWGQPCFSLSLLEIKVSVVISKKFKCRTHGYAPRTPSHAHTFVPWMHREGMWGKEMTGSRQVLELSPSMSPLLVSPGLRRLERSCLHLWPFGVLPPPACNPAAQPRGHGVMISSTA